MRHFEPPSRFVHKFPQSCSRPRHQCRSPDPSTPPHSHSPQPINTTQGPVTDGCRGHQGLAGAGRGLVKVRPGTGVFRIVVTWAVCLSMCRWMSSMWPCGLQPPSQHTLIVRALVAGQEAGMEGFSSLSNTTPQNLQVRLTQHPLTPALEKCSAKAREGGRQSKHRAQGSTNEPGQYGTMTQYLPFNPQGL